MLQELFDAFGKQAVLATTPKVIHPAEEPGHVYYLALCNGGLERKEAAAKPRQHVARSLQAVVEFAQREKGRAAVWFDRSRVVAILDDAVRRDVVTLHLTFSKPMKWLMAMDERPQGLSQKDLLLQLRTTFAGCLPDGELVACLRRVKFDNGQVIDSRIEHGKSSLGSQIRAEATGASAIPEVVVFDVPVFESGFPGLHYKVAVALEPEAQQCQFKLIPLAGQIEQALTQAEEAIGGQLTEELATDEVPVYYGQP